MAQVMPAIGVLCGMVGVLIGGLVGLERAPSAHRERGFLIGSGVGLLAAMCVSVGLVLLFAGMGWM